MMTMKTLGALALMTTLSVSTMGCSGKEKKDDDLISKKVVVPTYYERIDANTPYFFSDMMSAPYGKFEYDLFEMYAPAIAQVRTGLSRSLMGMPPDSIGVEDAFMLAVLDELDGNFSSTKLGKLGIDANGSFALYGVGVWPVARVALSDRKAFEAMIQRVQDKVGSKPQMIEHKGVKLMKISAANAPISVIMQVTDSSFTIGISENGFMQTYLDHFTGKVKPKTSMKQKNALLALQGEYKLKPFMTGYVDIKGLVAGVLGGSKSNELLAASLSSVAADIQGGAPPKCREELVSMASTMPRIVMGYKAVSKDRLVIMSGIENTNGLSKLLADSRKPLPLYKAPVTQSSLVWGGIGIDAGKFSKDLVGRLKPLIDSPFECPDLRYFNQIATMSKGLNNAPNYVKAIQGLSFVLNSFQLDQGQGKVDLDLGVVVRTTDPNGLFQSIKLLIQDPAWQNINPKADGVPVLLPKPAMLGMLGSLPELYIVMTNDSLGVVFNKDMAQRTSESLQGAVADGSPMVMSMYDVNRILKVVEDNTKDSLENSPEASEALQSMKASYANQGPTTITFTPNEKGFFFTGTTTFLPKAKK